MYQYKRELQEALSSCYTILSFREAIFHAFIKADKEHLEILKIAFPAEYKTFFAYKEFGIDLTQDEVLV